MNTKKLLLAGCLSALFVIAAGFVRVAPAAAANQCYFVKIEAPPATGGLPSGGPLSAVTPRFSVNPPGFRAPLNSCVTWVNFSKVAKVKIKFVKGLQCRAAVTGATGFHPGPNNCFITYDLPYGCTSSLVFTKAGVYDYVVESKSEGILAGRITVVK